MTAVHEGKRGTAMDAGAGGLWHGRRNRGASGCWRRYRHTSDRTPSATLINLTAIMTIGMYLSAADRVFLDCRGAGILVRHAHRTGPVTSR